MPTYQYRCTQCGHDLEAVQKFSDAALTECPSCGGQLRKVFNAVGVVFKGSGFYRNDSRAKDTSSDNGSKDTKTESSTSGDKSSGDSGTKTDTSADKKSGSAPTGGSTTEKSSSKASSTGSSAPA